ncbi:MAG TPA: hypothetical protein VFI47_31335, partial [Acidimicrobiales bacterium]|nr:hypothetical protein [Acidimicrobiales bacterium]
PLTGRDPAGPLTGRDPAGPLTGRDPAGPLTGRDPAGPLTGRDAVGAADRLRRAVAADIAGVLAGAPATPGRIHVGWVAALDAAACPARYRGGGEEGWGFPGWSPGTAAGAIGRSALDRHLAEHDRPGPAPPPLPLEAVRAWMRSAATGAEGVAGWVAERRRDGDAATLAAAAAGAARWLAGFVRVLGWPLPHDLALLNVPRPGQPAAPATWRPPGSPGVTVAGGADARLGRVSGAGRFSLVVHRPTGGDDGGIRRRATVEAAAGALARGIAPEAVAVTAGDTGERVRLDVDGGVLAEGGRMVVEVVRQRVVALDRGFDPGDATPSPGCRRCDHRDRCAPGRAWLAGAARGPGGLPVLP